MKEELYSSIHKLFIQILDNANMTPKMIEIYIKKNEYAIQKCIAEYIEEFGEENAPINEDWIDNYIMNYFA